MAPVNTENQSDLIYFPRKIHGLHRCQGRDQCGQCEKDKSLRWV